jgi:glycerol-3-phosphate acyltransferase PlsY
VDLLLILLAYLIGSIPTGILVGRLAGIDVRTTGSGNIGATNVARTAGRKAGIVTLIGDVAKGAVAVALTGAFASSPLVAPASGLAAFLGHVYSVFLRFSGGKGVATGLGVCLALAPGAMLAPIAVFAITFGITRIVSVASLAGTWLAPMAMLTLGLGAANVLVATVIALVVTIRHQDNIRRLRAGIEPRFGDGGAASGPGH